MNRMCIRAIKATDHDGSICIHLFFFCWGGGLKRQTVSNLRYIIHLKYLNITFSADIYRDKNSEEKQASE